MHIKVTKGLDIPIKGKPEGDTTPLIPSGEVSSSTPSLISLNLGPFEEIKLGLLVKMGESVKIGQPLALDKDTPSRLFCSPAAGVIQDIRRGVKRRLLDIVIQVSQKEDYHEFPSLDPATASSQEILSRLLEGGLFAYIRQRPFNFLANPTKTPRSIFIKAVESAPFVPSAELQIAGYEKEFKIGLRSIEKLTPGKVHLVYRANTNCKDFLQADHVHHHTVEGPHPCSNASLHIQNIDPINSFDDVVWTLTAHDVVKIGFLLMHGRYLVDRVISIAGPAILEDRAGFFKTRAGVPISSLIAGRLKKGAVRLISGDVLTGHKVEDQDFLGFYHHTFCAVPEGMSREFLHFFKLGTQKYSFSRAYLSGHLDNAHREYEFTTNQHGEERPFIDGTLYDQVMPLQIPTMLLIKAIMAEDYESATELGLLEVDSEDFALTTFVCPSKIEMGDIVKQGLQNYASDLFHH